MGYGKDVSKGFFRLIVIIIFIVLIALTVVGIVWLVISNFYIVMKIVGVLILSGIAIWILIRFLNFLAKMGREKGSTSELSHYRPQNTCPAKLRGKSF